MIKVYVAGAYSDDNVLGVLRNIGRGQEYAAKLFQLGFSPFAPWFDKEFVILRWREEFAVEMFYDYSMDWLKVSDCVFVVPDHDGLINWDKSKGTLKEVEMARSINIPVFFNIKELHYHFKNYHY